MSSPVVLQDKSHETISSYFIGPNAENIVAFSTNITNIIGTLQNARENYHKKHCDEVWIPRLAPSGCFAR